MCLSFITTEGSKRSIWALDSFEGFPALVDEDEASSSFEEGLGDYRQFDIPYVLKTLADFGISKCEIDRHLSILKGFIPDSCCNYNGGDIAVLYIDLDIYEGYRDALAFFYGKVIPGRVIAFDEYAKPLDVHKWPGAAKAINEFLLSHDLFDSLMTCPFTGNKYVIKP